jgi:hypothetical protein
VVDVYLAGESASALAHQHRDLFVSPESLKGWAINVLETDLADANCRRVNDGSADDFECQELQDRLAATRLRAD